MHRSSAHAKIPKVHNLSRRLDVCAGKGADTYLDNILRENAENRRNQRLPASSKLGGCTIPSLLQCTADVTY